MSNKIAHNLLDKERTSDVNTESNINFNNLLLSEPVLKGLRECGFLIPSPIQHKALPLGRCGFDLMLKAKSGTGKTAVFAITALEMLKTDMDSVQVLIVAPTREIAVQIQDVVINIGKHVQNLKVSSFIGGMPLEDDLEKVNCHIAVGTPGRIKHLIDTKALKTDHVRVFVLDEADKLMDSSFQKTINDIFNTLPSRKQIIASSATYPQLLEELLRKYMNSPMFICPETDSPVLLGLTQFVCIVKPHLNVMQQMKIKNSELFEILSKVSFTQCLIFSNYQSRAESISNILKQKGWNTVYISAAQNQPERLKAFKKLKDFKCRILLTTDLSARGIDASNVDLVINYDIPNDCPTYLHRMGRAGRYGSRGICINLAADGKELQKFKNILGEIGGVELFAPVIKIDENFHENIWTIDISKMERVFGSIVGDITKVNAEDMREIVHDLIKTKDEETEEETVASKLENLSVTQEQSTNLLMDNENFDSKENNFESEIEKYEISEQIENISEMNQTTNDTNKVKLRSLLQNLAAGESTEETNQAENKNELQLKILLENLASGIGKNIPNATEKTNEVDELYLNSVFEGKWMEEENNKSSYKTEFIKDEVKLEVSLGAIPKANNEKQEEVKAETNLKELIKDLASGNNITENTSSGNENSNEVFTRNVALLNVAKLITNHDSEENVPSESDLYLNKYLHILKNKDHVEDDLLPQGEKHTSQNSVHDDKKCLETSIDNSNSNLTNIFKIGYDYLIKPKSPHWTTLIKTEDNHEKESDDSNKQDNTDSEIIIQTKLKRDKRKTKSYKCKTSKSCKRSKLWRDCDINGDGFSDECFNETVYTESGDNICENDAELAKYSEDPITNFVGATYKVPNSIDQTAVSYFDYYNNILWNDALTFEDVPSFDSWFWQWQSQVQSVREYIQQKVYLEEMNKFQQME